MNWNFHFLAGGQKKEKNPHNPQTKKTSVPFHDLASDPSVSREKLCEELQPRWRQ